MTERKTRKLLMANGTVCTTEVEEPAPPRLYCPVIRPLTPAEMFASARMTFGAVLEGDGKTVVFERDEMLSNDGFEYVYREVEAAGPAQANEGWRISVVFHLRDGRQIEVNMPRSGLRDELVSDCGDGPVRFRRVREMHGNRWNYSYQEVGPVTETTE